MHAIKNWFTGFGVGRVIVYYRKLASVCRCRLYLWNLSPTSWAYHALIRCSAQSIRTDRSASFLQCTSYAYSAYKKHQEGQSSFTNNEVSETQPTTYRSMAWQLSETWLFREEKVDLQITAPSSLRCGCTAFRNLSAFAALQSNRAAIRRRPNRSGNTGNIIHICIGYISVQTSSMFLKFE